MHALLNGLKLAVILFGSYGLISWNTRAVAHGHYWRIAVSDFAIAFLGFFMLHQVIEAHTWVEQTLYAVGGAGGSIFGVWLSKRFPSSREHS